MRDIIKKTLKNGLDVYFYKDKNMKRTLVSYNVHYGSNGYFDKFYYEGKLCEMQPGMAHFLEHTLIETCSLGNMVHKFRDKNYDFNGLTYGDLTSYYFVGIKDIEESLRELIEMVDAPAFDKEKIEKVKYAIVDEVRKNEDAKYRLAYNINKRNLFRNFEWCPESGNQLGSIETTLSITLEDVKTCYDAFYNFDNKFLVIGGNIDVPKYLELLEEIMGTMDVHERKMELLLQEVNSPSRLAYQEITKPIDSEHLIVSYKIGGPEVDALLLDIVLFIFLRIKFSNDTKFVNGLVEAGVIQGKIGWDTQYFEGDTIVTFGVDIKDKEKFLKLLDEELKEWTLEENKVNLLKRNLIANELSKLDYIYRTLQKFPTDLVYSQKLFILDELKDLNFKEIEEVLQSISFDNKSVLLVKKAN